ncbi:MAG TPA: DUF4395 domain-containing protein [Actinomycetota bacterium]|nr:DUF4395 domain-containing protein [Actinomycetota bacterium]
MDTPRRMVDTRQPRFGQFLTGTVAAAAFVFRLPGLFVALAVILGLAALSPATSPWRYLFLGFKRVAGLGPPKELEDAAPPRFANTLGFVFFTLASLLFYGLHAEGPAYGIGALVAVLGFLGAAGFCVGCEIYLWIARARGRPVAATVQRG